MLNKKSNPYVCFYTGEISAINYDLNNFNGHHVAVQTFSLESNEVVSSLSDEANHKHNFPFH